MMIEDIEQIEKCHWRFYDTDVHGYDWVHVYFIPTFGTGAYTWYRVELFNDLHSEFKIDTKFDVCVENYKVTNWNCEGYLIRKEFIKVVKDILKKAKKQREL